VRVYAQYVLLSLHTQTHLPLPSHLYIGSEPRADILLEKVVFSLPHYKSFIAAAVNDWVSGDKTSCSSSILPLHAMACIVDMRSPSDETLPWPALKQAEWSPLTLAPESRICDWWLSSAQGHHILLGKPSIIIISLLCCWWSFGSPSTFTVCFHRILFFSITKPLKSPPKTLHLPKPPKFSHF